MDYILGYREVIPDQTLPEKWKEIILNTGGSQSTLQDIKVPERAGGYSYKNPSRYITRNRFIYWRITHDVIELVEESLDINLINNRVRYKFTDTPILDGISIHETSEIVIILIITVSSIHKLSFTHPNKTYKEEQTVVSHVDRTMQSIFSEASIHKARDPHTFYIIPSSGSTNPPVAHAGSSCLTVHQDKAVFALAYNSGVILVLRLDIVTGTVNFSELKQESTVPRFLSGIATAFRSRTLENEIATSLVLHTHNNNVYLFSISRGGYLRMWSCNEAQYVTGIDLAINNRDSIRNIQNCLLKNSIILHHEIYLCTYIKYITGCEFAILKVVKDAGFLKFIRHCTIDALDQHLVDYSFSETRIWALWRTTEVDAIAVTHVGVPLQSADRNSEWEPVVLIQSSDRDYVISDGSSIDPRQAYIDYIFHPGKFSLKDIIRALSIYRKLNHLGDMHLSPTALKEKVCLAVEAEIQNEVMDYELMDEDYLEIVNRCWSKFYSCVLQYHINKSRPVGLVLLPDVLGVVLLKKSSFSLLRPMEVIEHMMLCNENTHFTRFNISPALSQDENICQDLITLTSALTYLEQRMIDDVKSNFEKQLYYLKSPDIIVDNLSELLLDTDEFTDLDFKSGLLHILENIKDIASAMAMLLEFMTYNLSQPNPSKLRTSDGIDKTTLANSEFLFGSDLGTSTIAESVTQIAVLRFSMCRNLLILQNIILSRSEILDSYSLHTIKSSLAPRTVVLTQAYYVIMWISETSTSVVPSQSLVNASAQRLLLLKLFGATPHTQHQNRSFTILELFVKYGAKHQIYDLIDHSNSYSSNLKLWHNGLLSYINTISQLIWPISGNFEFPEWLLKSCQFLLVQEYVRLLSTWCEWNSASRKFILAVSLLEVGETEKACDYFLRASNGVLVDSFLSSLITSSNTASDSSALVLYYLKVIEIFEQHNAFDCIIELAMTAIAVAETNEPNLPTLHSIVFTQHLHLQHHIEAYNCLNTNPDNQRRVDCLRLLVLALFNRKKLIELASFPYVDMYTDLEKIMESRARSADLLENNYYDFLYSFHINKGNIRKAASIMYEQAIRLGQESYSLLTISKITHCLLSCINALHLVNEKYRWIVRPVMHANSSEEEKNLTKNRSELEEEILQFNLKKQIEVLELKDIKKEYILAEAKLKLIKFNPDHCLATQTCPSEIAAALCSAGLYLKALQICECYKLCKIIVIESLTSQCIKYCKKDATKVWKWLHRDNINDFGVSTLNAVDMSWNVLKHFTLTQENYGESILHKEVSRKLYHRGLFLPQWLLSSYAIHKLLQDTLIKYFKTVKRVSEDMIRIKTRNY
ncbi:nuclear pore complex protein Nup160 homolog isoform X3 [Nasonia vitripennis]|uniref:Nuclear pore complex protein Nup160 homolog n=1 Tax=Nasonia vitripennis TaxID=7425 RepID=A0A7M7T831_NASVI|nr:nuclear pore complex protein Nup160 homolog isoform X3 [Nasonia vitripennis]